MTTGVKYVSPEEKAIGATKYEADLRSRLSKLLEQKEPQP